MPYVSLHDYCPDVAERETRCLLVTPGSRSGLPPADYAFLELYCDEPGCDCRRVFFTVLSSRRKRVEAVVAWGWEEPVFYAQWMKDDDPQVVADLKGPSLNFLSPQSPRAPAILELVRDVLLQDPAYVERLKRHYRLFKQKVESGQGPPDRPTMARRPRRSRR